MSGVARRLSPMASHATSDAPAPAPRRPPGALPVSVVIPAYNAERFVGDALASVRAQTAPPAEIIVVDDGSTDGTAAVARAAGATVITQPNGGVAVARNTGIRAASAEWVALLDADDLWQPEKLEAQWAAVQACPDVGFVFTDFTQFNAAGIEVPSVLGSRPNYQRVKREEVAPGVVALDRESLLGGFFEGNFVLPSSWLVRRALALDVGLFDAGLSGRGASYCEDREFYLRAVRVTEVAAVERPVTLRRIHDSNLSSNDIDMLMGRAMVAERILASPERYPASALPHARWRHPIELTHAGGLLLEAGRFPEARDVLRRSLRSRFRLRTVLLYALALGGRHLYRSARLARQIARRTRVTA